ncbi:MAG TPA: hypothetical protein DCZ94_05970 [Lentisphaeria bacterium]|nr:MAG: hypothetical protein A2X48_07480 [Lentisphaerae bacterium GWF2_49_21]HBC86483.1 hypothetical protein [Lentisphaeria bacterium]
MKDSDNIVGVIPFSGGMEINFYLTSSRGSYFANIRQFARSSKYAGPTKKGISFNKTRLQKIVELLETLPADIENIEAKVISDIPLHKGKSIRLSIAYFNGKYGIDIREYFTTPKYNGPGKSGIRIPYEYINELKEYCRIMLPKLDEWPEDTLFHENEPQGENNIHPEEGEKQDVEGVPDEYKQFFE